MKVIAPAVEVGHEYVHDPVPVAMAYPEPVPVPRVPFRWWCPVPVGPGRVLLLQCGFVSVQGGVEELEEPVRMGPMGVELALRLLVEDELMGMMIVVRVELM